MNNAFYEIAPEDYKRVGFLRNVPDDHCIKIGPRGLFLLPGNHHEYRVIFMRRSTDEIWKSTETVWPDLNRMPKEVFDDIVQNLMHEAADIADARSDVKAVTIWYPDLVKNPIKEFSKLQDIDIPIDLDSAGLIDPTLYRHKAA